MVAENPPSVTVVRSNVTHIAINSSFGFETNVVDQTNRAKSKPEGGTEIDTAAAASSIATHNDPRFARRRRFSSGRVWDRRSTSGTGRGG